MEKIILYYKYVEIEHPHLIAQWHRSLCERLSLKGRVLIACEGINGTLGGASEALEEYKLLLAEHPLFSGIDFKESVGSAQHFPRLRVMVKKEIVRLGLSTAEVSSQRAAPHLTPAQAHALIAQHPQDLVIFDARNAYESEIGSFTGAVTPKINTFRELPDYIDSNLELFKDKDVLMYCTGGVRCERASAYLETKKVARSIHQIEGGIHRYLESFPDGFFRGKNFVFDARMALSTNEDIVGRCQTCKSPYDQHRPCLYANCNQFILLCPACLQASENAVCSQQCSLSIQANPERQRSNNMASKIQEHNV